ncbi:MAG: SAM-dependent methyltransferase, partial [Acetatifactor sp.]|nr:SAM-dependent methyltransferase [Acetatifactor sp.]
EFIEDILDQLPGEGAIHVVDFGCGKSYLTFAMYYYLHVMQGRDIHITGLDLKADVIRHCNELAAKCGYEQLQFQVGDISTYEGTQRVDMVVSLHACDTATDYALEKAVSWGARVILAVPCCQHEVNRQIHCRELEPVLRYGVIRERMSALITDALRAGLLEQQGYDTQILEFIDMEHTPKNLLIRAVKKSQGTGQPHMLKKQDTRQETGTWGQQGTVRQGKSTLQETMELLGVNPTLARLLDRNQGL